MNEELPSINDFIEDISQLPSVSEEVESVLPSVEDYIEKEEEVLTEETVVETNTDSTEIIVSLIESVRNSIPEVKSYDKELYELMQLIEEVRKEIPVVPEPPEMPEVRYYDEEIQELKESIPVVPEVKYYDEQISELQESIQEVKDRDIPDFRWIGNTFNTIDENYESLSTSLATLKGRLDLEVSEIVESIETSNFEKGVDVKRLDESISTTKEEVTKNIFETKEKIWKELKETSLRIWNLNKEYKADSKELRKETKLLYKELGQQIAESIETSDTKIDKLNEYFKYLVEEISELPEVKYYDEQIDEVNKSISSVKNLVEVLENKLNKKIAGLKESILVVPPTENNTDPLTPLDQNFATLDDLSSHYRLFLNRIQQQLATLGGGGEVRLEFLDDVDRTTAKVDGKFLKYDASTDKWVGASASGGSFSGTEGQFLQHNGTEFVGVGSTAVSNTIRDASQGFYGYTTDFYTVGVANTIQELGEDEYDLVMPQVAVGGTYSYLPTRMHTCNNGNPWVGSGATIGTGQTEFSLAGTIPRSTVLVRFAYDFIPDVDDSDLDLRLHFTTNTTTQTGIGLTNFDIDKQGLVCAVGAGITYSGETLISFFVGETLAGDTKSEAGRFCVQANASDGGELEVKALNIIVDV